jgi:hypothetical protein
MLKNHEQESQRTLDMFAKKQELLLRHRLEFQRQNRVSRRIKASIADLKAGQKKQAESINSVMAVNDENIAAINHLNQNMTSLTNEFPALEERLLQTEQIKAAETISQAFIVETETRLSVLEDMHDGLKRDS